MEITFEQSLGALEAAPGTAITTPTRLLNNAVVIKPRRERKFSKDSRGTTEKNYRKPRVTKAYSEFDVSGDFDINQAPFWFEQRIRGGVTPTQPDSGTAPNVYLWEYIPGLTSKTQKTSTLWGWDPNVQRVRSAYNILRTLTLKGDNADDVQFEGSGSGAYPTTVTVAAPASTTGKSLANYAKLYIDTGASAFGTTPVVGRLVNWSFELPDTYGDLKYLGDTPDWTDVGLIESAPMLKIELEVPDLDQYTQYVDEDLLKVRLHIDGDVIGGALKEYLEIDVYGTLDLDDFGDYATSNRTFQFTLEGINETGLGASYRVAVQNTTASIT